MAIVPKKSTPMSRSRYDLTLVRVESIAVYEITERISILGKKRQAIRMKLEA